jgi:hypothetical protein
MGEVRPGDCFWGCERGRLRDFFGERRAESGERRARARSKSKGKGKEQRARARARARARSAARKPSLLTTFKESSLRFTSLRPSAEREAACGRGLCF